MRIFNSAVAMYEETFREIFKRGQTVFDKTVQGKIVSEVEFEQKEIVGYSYMLTGFEDIDDMMLLAKNTYEKEHMSPRVAEIWFNDMISNASLHEEWWGETEYTQDYFKKFCDEGGDQASYSYGERIVPQIESLLARLKGNLYSRGAIINVWDSRDVSRIGRRVPCTLAYHFMVRKTIDGDRMNLIVSQRSCDMINFFPLDIYKSYLFLKYVAKAIGVEPGYIIHNINSAHVYKKDIPERYTW